MKFDTLVSKLLNEKGGGDDAYRPAMLRSIYAGDSPNQRKYKIDEELRNSWGFNDAERASYFQQLGNYGLVDRGKMQSVFQQMLSQKRSQQPQQPQPQQPQPQQPQQ